MAAECDAGDDETIGRLLRAYRTAAGLTQDALARRAFVGVQTIGYLERDLVMRPQRETVARLVRALDLPEADRERLERARRRQPPRAPRGKGPTIGRRIHVDVDPRAVPIVNIFVPLNGAAVVMPPAHLVTLTGPPRETTVVASAAHRLFHLRGYDNVYIVALAGIADPARLPGAILAAITGAAETSLAAGALLDRLRTQHLLLIFDRCEHLIEPCAALIDDILRECAAICVLTTSTEPLQIEGEMVRRIAPLA